jgi:hypothetical protein
LILYDIHRSSSEGAPGDLVASTWAPSWTDFVCGLDPTFYYSVRARDAVGNRDGNDIQTGLTAYGVFLPLIAK